MVIMEKRIWWATLPERCIYDLSYNVGLRMAYVAGQRGYVPIYPEYGRTDATRQGIALAFMRESHNPDDTLVMTDIDHDHAPELIERLVARDVPVVVPLMFRRSAPYEACAFRRGEDGKLHHLASFEPGLYRMDAVGAGAIAIQRRVFEQIGLDEWYWQYRYDASMYSPSEDLYFSGLCERKGIAMYVDTTIESPHMALSFIDRDTHVGYMADHPEALGGTVKVAHPTP